MKKFIAAAFAALLLLSLLGCAQATPSAPGSVENSVESSAVEKEKLKIVATIFPQYDFVRQIAGDHVELTMLMRPGAETHSFEPSLKDMTTIQQCDLFIYVGGESDVWVDRILSSLDVSGIKFLKLMDMVTVVEEEFVQGMEEKHEHGEHEGHGREYDEHVWTSPLNAKLIVSAISQALCELDEDNAEEYAHNTEAYQKQLDELDMQFRDVVDGAVRKTLIFGDRFPFRYFADEYGLTYFAAFPGCSSETEASAGTIAFLIDKVKQENIPVVFHVELSSEMMADTICEATGAKKLLLHAVHNISLDDFAAGAGYLELMSGNVENLREALQ